MDMGIALQEILEAINQRLGQRDLACPLCEGRRWTMPSLIAPLEMIFASPTADLAPTGRMLPMAVLCCDQCGYSISLNLIQLGLWEKWQTHSQLIVPGGATLPSNGALRSG